MILKTIKQPDKWSCTIACVQMITFRPRKELLKVINRKDEKDYKTGVNISRFIPYLYDRKIIIGSFAEFKPMIKNITKYSDLVIGINKDQPALLIVKSKTITHEFHIILWDGKNLRDSSLSEEETSNINSYKVKQWISISFMTKKKAKRFFEYYHN